MTNFLFWTAENKKKLVNCGLLISETPLFGINGLIISLLIKRILVICVQNLH
jgi:hypothetical protein